MTIYHNAPRYLRSFLHHTLAKLYILKVDGEWRFAVPYQNQYVLIGKSVKSRDTARTEALKRYGMKALEVRNRKAA